MIINLTKDEYRYLISAYYIDKQILDVLSKFNDLNDVIVIELQDELVELLREKLEDRLQVSGFDINYELTKDGYIIENLIDKLFIG